MSLVNLWSPYYTVPYGIFISCGNIAAMSLLVMDVSLAIHTELHIFRGVFSPTLPLELFSNVPHGICSIACL